MLLSHRSRRSPITTPPMVTPGFVALAAVAKRINDCTTATLYFICDQPAIDLQVKRLKNPVGLLTCPITTLVIISSSAITLVLDSISHLRNLGGSPHQTKNTCCNQPNLISSLLTKPSTVSCPTKTSLNCSSSSSMSFPLSAEEVE